MSQLGTGCNMFVSMFILTMAGWENTADVYYIIVSRCAYSLMAMTACRVCSLPYTHHHLRRLKLYVRIVTIPKRINKTEVKYIFNNVCPVYRGCRACACYWVRKVYKPGWVKFREKRGMIKWLHLLILTDYILFLFHPLSISFSCHPKGDHCIKVSPRVVAFTWGNF